MSAVSPSFAGLPIQSGKASGTIPANAQIKCVGVDTYAVLATTDDPSKSVGVCALAALSGQAVYFVPAGPKVVLLNDGNGSIAAGDYLGRSPSVAGSVRTSTTPGLAIAVSASPASASPVIAIWMGAGMSGGAGETLAQVAANAAAAADDIMTAGFPVVVLSSQADAAANIAFKVDTSVAWTQGNDRFIATLQNHAVELLRLTAAGNLGVRDGQGIYPIGQEGTYGFTLNSANPVIRWQGGGTQVCGSNDNDTVLGTTALQYAQAWSYLYGTKKGGALSVASNTIVPTSGIHHVGAGLIKTITVPLAGAFVGSIVLIPDAAFTYDNTGNIVGGAGLAIVNQPMTATFDGTSWYMSY